MGRAVGQPVSLSVAIESHWILGLFRLRLAVFLVHALPVIWRSPFYFL